VSGSVGLSTLSDALLSCVLPGLVYLRNGCDMEVWILFSWLLSVYWSILCDLVRLVICRVKVLMKRG